MFAKLSEKHEKYALIIFHVICFSFISYLLRQHKYDLNQDHAMYLYAGKLIAQGKIPFIDFFDINPPLVMYLSSFIVELAQKISVNEIYLFKVTVSLIYFSFTYISTKVLKSEFNLSLLKCLICITLLTAMMTTLIQTSVWGQRDELFGFAATLYLLLKAMRIKSLTKKEYQMPISKLQITWISICFGIFICFKPHFFLVFLGAEVFSMYLAKNYRTLYSREVCIPAFISLLYIAFILMLPSQALSNLIESSKDVLKYYDSYNKFRNTSIFYAFSLFAPALFSLVYFLYRRISVGPIIALLCAAVPVFVSIIFLQGRFFYYHYSALYILGTYLSIIAICMPEINLRSIKSLFAVIPSLFVVSYAIAGGYRYLNGEDEYFRYRKNLTMAVAKYVSAGDSVITLASSPIMSYPIYNNLGLINASRYLFQYPLSFFGTRRFNPQTKQLDVELDPETLIKEDKYFNDLKADIERNKPKIIYYDSLLFRPQNFPSGFPLQQYLKMKGLITFIEGKYDHVAKEGFMVYQLRN